METSYSLPPEHVAFECEITFWMAFEIQQIVIEPVQIFIHLLISNF